MTGTNLNLPYEAATVGKNEILVIPKVVAVPATD